MVTASFRPEHLEMIDPVGGTGLMWSMVSRQLRAAEPAGQVMAVSMMDGDTVHAIGGVYELWNGVGEAFSIVGREAQRHPVSMCKLFKRSLGMMIKAGKYRRIQATVKVGFTQGVRFIEYLGFHREGTMGAWSPDGSDVYLYAIVRP